MLYQIKAKSGLTGWRGRLQENYRTFKIFTNYCSIYGIHNKLEFSSIRKAWNSNPVIEGSVLPSDFGIAPAKSKLWKHAA